MDIPPLLLLVFNRVDQTNRLFSVIRSVRPKKLYIVADGPRENRGDAEKCAKVRAIFSHIDWECQVERLYRDTNRGLEKGLCEAISWFFDKEEYGVILEDDCIPDPSFFSYCGYMLEHFADDSSVMMINGSNFLSPSKQDSSLYYYSPYPHFWGWASWRRAWKKFDGSMTDWPEYKKSSAFASLFTSPLEQSYFEMIFDSTYKGRTNSWGYRWMYSIWKASGLCISPGVNLVRNIGFTKDATHKVLRKFELPTHSLKVPPLLASNDFSVMARKETMKRYYAINPLMIMALKTYYSLKS